VNKDYYSWSAAQQRSRRLGDEPCGTINNRRVTVIQLYECSSGANQAHQSSSQSLASSSV